ncbi:MAG: hypothetical protein ACN4G0_20205 [Polyangiales bacterium]
MKPLKNQALEGLLSSAERWTPGDAELWRRWRGTLSEEQRSGLLLPLQALLSGLVAYRKVENHSALVSQSDYRSSLRAVHAGYDRAIDLVARLLRNDARLPSPGTGSGDPYSSLLALDRSLRDAFRVSGRLLDLPSVDSGAFEASTDFFLRELERNAFFSPAEPLQFLNVDELVGPDVLAKDLDFWKSGAAKMVAFLTLLRANRFLGIADRELGRELGANDGAQPSEVIVAGVQRELGALKLFLSLQGLDQVQAGLEDVDLRAVDDARAQLKEAAKSLRSGTEAQPTERRSQRVPKSVDQDIWAFRFILRAFIAKASALPPEGEDRDFAQEFARHFRAFGPKLMRATGYPYARPLTTAVSSLNRRALADKPLIDIAAMECERFAEHLDAALETPARKRNRFDKGQAAEQLRRYLETARLHSADRRAAAAAFGLMDPDARAS